MNTIFYRVTRRKTITNRYSPQPIPYIEFFSLNQHLRNSLWAFGFGSKRHERFLPFSMFSCTCSILTVSVSLTFYLFLVVGIQVSFQVEHFLRQNVFAMREYGIQNTEQNPLCILYTTHNDKVTLLWIYNGIININIFWFNIKSHLSLRTKNEKWAWISNHALCYPDVSLRKQIQSNDTQKIILQDTEARLHFQ